MFTFNVMFDDKTILCRKKYFTKHKIFFAGALRIQAYFKDTIGERANAELLMLSHYSPFNKQLKVTTSTNDARVSIFV